ncbi:TPA: hypothetical protein ACXNPR_000429 [Enterobacter cancerogenus]
MAFKNMFMANNVKVEIALTPASGVATTFTVVEKVAAFPAVAGAETNMATVNSFGELYAEKIPGSKNVPDISLTVNWIPGATGQELLNTYADNLTKVQLRVTYYENLTGTDGASYFQVVNGYISTNTTAGDFDSQAQREYTFVVTGAPVASGETAGD